MIPAWLRALVLAGLVLFVLADLGAPLVVRVQLDATASDAATTSGRSYVRYRDAPGARTAAAVVVARADASLDHFAVYPDGRVTLTVSRQVPSRVFDRISQLDSWYDVQVETTSTGGAL